MGQVCKSPCTGHCYLNRQEICSGCGRTKVEISNWSNMNEKEKEEAAIRSKDRLRASSLRLRNKGGDDDK